MAALRIVSGAEAPKPEDDSKNEFLFNVGTRKSKLALKQADLVVAEAVNHHPEYNFAIRARDTAAGDIDKVTPFKDMPVKNIWTHELETLMIEKELDFIAHSLKDVPTQLPDNCEIGATITREDPRDVLVIKKGRPACNIQDLPAGSVIGTSSIRRTAQIARLYPDLVIKDMRGNINTRVSKLDAEDSGYDALILAAAGLLRTDVGDRISQYLDSSNGGILYAVGQGAVGVENRSDDAKAKRVLNSINHLPTFYSTTTERSLLRTIEGGCSAPLGVESRWQDDVLHIKAVVVSVDGKEAVSVEVSQKVASVSDAERLGQEAASKILANGADKILAEIKAKKPTTVIDLENK